MMCSACERPTTVAAAYPNPTPGQTMVSYTGKALAEVITPPATRTEVSLEHVPSEIVSDYREAIRCLQAQAYKGTAVLARRAVEAICDHLLELLAEAPRKVREGVLWDKIDHLRSQNELTNKLASLAHKVRVFGKYGAHPTDDGLDEVTKKDAERALIFLEQLLQHVFIAIEDEVLMESPSADG